MIVAGYFWYKQTAGNEKLFNIINLDIFSKPQFAPLVVILLGITAILYGISSYERYNR